MRRYSVIFFECYIQNLWKRVDVGIVMMVIVTITDIIPRLLNEYLIFHRPNYLLYHFTPFKGMTIGRIGYSYRDISISCLK